MPSDNFRKGIAEAKRVVIKIGSSSLTRADGRLDLNRIDQVAGIVARMTRRGQQVVLVSSGAVAAGIDPLGLPGRPRDLPTAQACAAMGQGLLVARWAAAFQAHFRHVAQVLFTVEDVMRRDHYKNARQALERLLHFGVVPIVNENDTVSTADVRFGDNDRLAAYVSHLIDADALVLLTDVDGLYTAPPSSKNAKFIEQVSSLEDLKAVVTDAEGSVLGTGGMTTKVAAAVMAVESGVEVVLCAANVLSQAVDGQKVGTYFPSTGKRRPSRTLWIAHAARSRGQLVLDDGAVHAITVRKKSLLLAGVLAVRGDFTAGEVVELVGSTGRVARGITSYDSDIADKFKGMSLEELQRAGAPDTRPIIHRDDMALLEMPLR
ncbi:MAG TPA: glutamate 5-kinase [Actinomyces sp.]|jgi:glutamate 5-kinase|nr:glutamate 5-kinase [Actinomyces sp.]